MKGQTEEVAVYLRFKKKNTTQTSVEGWNSLCGLFVADSLTICKCMCFKIKHIFSVFRGKSQSNSLPVTHAIGLSWHQGLFRVRWRKLHLQGVGCFSWIFLSMQTKIQKDFVLSKGQRSRERACRAEVTACSHARPQGPAVAPSTGWWHPPHGARAQARPSEGAGQLLPHSQPQGADPFS